VERLLAQAIGLRRLAVRLVGEDGADDVVQDALVAGLHHAPSEAHALRPWLVRVIRNFAGGRHRGAARRQAREADSARPEAVPSASDMVERMEVQRVVAEEVLRLTEPYRRAVLAIHFEGLSAEEYARGLGVPSATVRSWLKRGLDTLRTRLDARFGGDRSAWSACLLSLARPESALVPLAIGGGILMKKLAVVLAVLVLALLAWRGWPDSAAPGIGSTPALVNSVEMERPASALESIAVDSIAEEAGRSSVSPSAPARTTTSVTGRLVWKPGDQPAVHIGVRLAREPLSPRWGELPLVMTDDAGRFAFSNVEPGRYQVHVDRFSLTKLFDVGDDPVVFTVGAEPVVLDAIALQRQPDVTGRVLEPDGTIVPGAEVYLVEPNSICTRLIAVTGNDGTYRFESPDRFAGFFARVPGRAPSGMRQPWRVEDRVIDLILGGVPGSMRGQVVDPRGNPVMGAIVAVRAFDGVNGVDEQGATVEHGDRRSLSTDAEGVFACAELEAGRTRVQVFVPGFPDVSEEIHVFAGQCAQLAMRLPATARVRGRITDGSGQPLEGVKVYARALGIDAETMVETDANGDYETSLVPAGKVRLLTQGVGPKWPLYLRAQLDTVLEPNAEFVWSPTIARSETIRGRLVDLGGLPLAGQVVKYAEAEHTRVRTDSDGRFVFEAMLPQSYGLQFDADGLSAYVTAWGGDEDVLLVAENCSARVVGRLLDARKQPMPGVELLCNRVRTKTQEDGTFEFANLRSGEQSVQLERSLRHGCRLARCSVDPGALRDLGDLVVPDPGSLRVRATSADSVPIAWTKPGLAPSGDVIVQYVQGRWDEHGEWLVEDLAPGEYTLGVSGADTAACFWSFAVRTGERTDLDVDLRLGAPVEVAVLFADGLPPPRELEVQVFDAAEHLVVKKRNAQIVGAEAGAAVRLTLLPGTYAITARATDGRSGSATLTVPAPTEKMTRVCVEVR